MKTVRWYGARFLSQFGWAGWAGLILLGFGIAVYWGATKPARLEVEDASAREITLKRTLLRDSHRTESAVVLTPAAQLTKFYAYFPNVQSIPEWLDRLYAIAIGESVVLAQGEYRLIRDADGKMLRYQITLPVKGSYLQIRSFVVNVLNDLPIAALDDISFRREAIGRAQLEARIKLTLFFRGQP